MSEEFLGKIIVIVFVVVLFITDLKDIWLKEVKKMIKKKIEKKKTIEPNGSITSLKNIFKLKSKNIGVFKKPEIERKDSIT
ncbi:hypothetical protein ES705_49218 [subsurface metagenome]